MSLLELWNLLDTPAEEQKIFHNVTCSIALTESEITEANILSVASIKRVSAQDQTFLCFLPVLFSLSVYNSIGTIFFIM